MKNTFRVSRSIVFLICLLPFTVFSKKKPELHFNEVKLTAIDGDADAQFELAGLYAGGEGVEQNLAEAVKWYRKAAEQGHDSAQFKLGLSYQQGKGVPQSDTEAYIWLNISAENGEPLNGRGKAGELADEIRVSLSAIQVEEAKEITKIRQKQISQRVEENYTRIINELNEDGWEVNMKIEDDGAHFARAFRPTKPVSNTAQASAPNWRIAFKVLRKHCREWPVKESEEAEETREFNIQGD
jgi:TPR repeat protein